MSKTFGIVLAAGAGRRMGRDKVMLKLGGKSVLVRSLEAIQDSGCFVHILLVCREDGMKEASTAARRTLRIPYTLVAGGSERQYSVANALAAIEEDGIVAVHDAARCLFLRRTSAPCGKGARDGRYAGGAARIPSRRWRTASSPAPSTAAG